MPLIESFNNGQNYQEKLIFFPERRKVRYSIGTFSFLERGDFSTISSSPLSSLSPTSASSAISDGKFSDDLVVEFVLLSTLASLAMSNGELVGWSDCGCSEHQSEWFSLSEALNETLIETGKIALILSSSIYCLLLTLLKLPPRRAQSYKFHCFWPATVMEGELSWALQPHCPRLLLSSLIIWLVI